MSSAKKIVIAAVAVGDVLLAAALVGASSYLVDYAIGRAGDGGDRNVEEVVFIEGEGAEARIEAERAAQALKTTEFLEQVSAEQVEIIAGDGVRLVGDAYEHEVDDNRWALVIHGYRDSNETAYVMDMVRHYYDAGFNVLAPDLRALGDSDGEYVGMGWLDRLDILDWIDWILAQDPSAQIVIHGVSMGAATTMMVSGEETPDAVKAFVEDCGYTSVWDVFSTELSRRFGLPEFPLLHSASALSGVLAGYSFEEVSALEAVARSTKPMLFIHGTADDFIPFDMVNQLFEAKTTGDKEMLVSEGAGHADAMYELSDIYWETVFNFVDRYIQQ